MAKYLLILPLVISSISAASQRYGKIDSVFNNERIVGGSDAPDGLYPYQVSIHAFGFHYCGGSIIDHEWILTATHCIDRYPTYAYSVYVGSNDLNGGGTAYKVLEIHQHEQHNPVTFKNDVAVLKVEPITYTIKVGPVVLETEDVDGDESCIVSGWGALGYPGPSPDKLQHIELKTTTVDFCKSSHSHLVDESEICTLTKFGEGVCHGDSGSPLVRKVNGTTKQIGIATWVMPCAVGYPDVFGRVSKFVPWIREKCNCI